MELFEKMRRPRGPDRRGVLENRSVVGPLEEAKGSKSAPLIHSTPGYSIGQLVAPKNENGGNPGDMRFERIPGAYQCSEEGTRLIYGLKILNPPLALVQLIEEVNYATPKQVFFFDSGPVVVEDNPHAVNWTSPRGYSTFIPIHLNPRRAVPELVAHELMHSWLPFYMGLDDLRTYVDPTNKHVVDTVNFLQSMVHDCTVLWQLRKRGGFDLDLFRKDIIADLRENIGPLMSGMMHATPLGQLMAAQALAVPKACADLYELTKEDNDEVERFWRFCRKAEPTIARTASKLVAALQNHGYQTESGIRAAIDESLIAAFEFLCYPFDPAKDMVRLEGKTALVDKFPDFLPGFPIPCKHEALWKSILGGKPIIWSAYSPEEKEYIIHFAREGFPYTSLPLPRIVRPKELGKPNHTFFFEQGTTEKQMEEWTPPVSSLPFPPLDVYGETYELSCKQNREPNRLPSEGDCHVLLP